MVYRISLEFRTSINHKKIKEGKIKNILEPLTVQRCTVCVTLGSPLKPKNLDEKSIPNNNNIKSSSFIYH